MGTVNKPKPNKEQDKQKHKTKKLITLERKTNQTSLSSIKIMIFKIMRGFVLICKIAAYYKNVDRNKSKF